MMRDLLFILLMMCRLNVTVSVPLGAAEARTTTIDYDLADLDETGADPGAVDTVNFADYTDQGAGYDAVYPTNAGPGLGLGSIDATYGTLSLDPVQLDNGFTGGPGNEPMSVEDPDVEMSAEDQITDGPNVNNALTTLTLAGGSPLMESVSVGTPATERMSTSVNPMEHTTLNTSTARVQEPTDIINETTTQTDSMLKMRGKSQIVTQQFVVTKPDRLVGAKENPPESTQPQTGNTAGNNKNANMRFSNEISGVSSENVSVDIDRQSSKESKTDDISVSGSTGNTDYGTSEAGLKSVVTSGSNGSNTKQTMDSSKESEQTSEGSISKTTDPNSAGDDRNTDETKPDRNDEITQNSASTAREENQHKTLDLNYSSTNDGELGSINNQSMSSDLSEGNQESIGSKSVNDSVEVPIHTNTEPDQSGTSVNEGSGEIHSVDQNKLLKCFGHSPKISDVCYIVQSLHTICMFHFSSDCPQDDVTPTRSFQTPASVNSMHPAADERSSSVGSDGHTNSFSVKTVESLSASFERSTGIFEIMNLIRGVCPGLCKLASSSERRRNIDRQPTSTLVPGQNDANDTSNEESADVDLSIDDIDSRHSETLSSNDISRNDGYDIGVSSGTSSGYYNIQLNTDSDNDDVDLSYELENESDETEVDHLTIDSDNSQQQSKYTSLNAQTIGNDVSAASAETHPAKRADVGSVSASQESNK